MHVSDQAKALEWFKTHVPPVCPSCHASIGFDVLNNIVAAPVYADGMLNVGGPMVPLVGLVCRNCFHVRFFSAVMMGITAPQRPTAVAPAPAIEPTPTQTG